MQTLANFAGKVFALTSQRPFQFQFQFKSIYDSNLGVQKSSKTGPNRALEIRSEGSEVQQYRARPVHDDRIDLFVPKTRLSYRYNALSLRENCDARSGGPTWTILLSCSAKNKNTDVARSNVNFRVGVGAFAAAGLRSN